MKMSAFWFLCCCCLCISLVYGFDSLDPHSNVTIIWDLLLDNDASQEVKVSMYNYQLYRHIELPGWKLSWEWEGDEVIWNMFGAEATEQGICSKFKGQLPHCCEKRPVIIDLLPGAPYNKQVANCCKGGVLSSMLQDDTKIVSSFQMSIGMNPDASSTESGATIPKDFQLGISGYTCGDPDEVPPSKFTQDQGRRQTRALRTWKVTCNYSQFRAAPAPSCCVALSAFYDSNIVPCPKCSCACQERDKQCVKSGELPQVLQLQLNEPIKPVVQCSNHMCPIKVHWHVKESYKEYWRVKMTVTNFNYAKNYSQWSVVVQHPNLKSVNRVFSFNYKPLSQYASTNDSGIFYGIQYYNDVLLHNGENGNVQTEILMRKDEGIFTFESGWTFPRRISYNGEECVMPQPDNYPRLPNAAPKQQHLLRGLLPFCIVLLALLFLI